MPTDPTPPSSPNPSASLAPSASPTSEQHDDAVVAGECRGEHLVGAVAAVAACLACAGSGRSSAQIAVSVLLVACGARWARGAHGGHRLRRVAVMWIAGLIAAGAALAVTLWAGQAGQMREVTRDAIASVAGFANLRFSTVRFASPEPMAMSSLFFPFVIAAIWLQSVVVVELIARGRRPNRLPDGRWAGLQWGASLAVLWLAVGLGALAAFVADVPWWVSPWRVAEFALGVVIVTPSPRRSRRQVHAGAVTVGVAIVTGAALLWATAMTTWDGDIGHLGTLADAGAPLVVALVAAGAAVCIVAVDASIRHAGLSPRSDYTPPWRPVTTAIGRVGFVPVIFAAPAAAVIDHQGWTGDHDATAMLATIVAVALSIVVVEAVRRGPGVAIGALAGVQVLVLLIGTATIAIPSTGPQAADPMAQLPAAATVGDATVGGASTRTVAVIGDDSLISLLRTAGLAADSQAEPSRCGLLRRGDRRTAVDENLGRLCTPWAVQLDELGVGDGTTVVAGVGVWDLFDWRSDTSDGPLGSVADPAMFDAVADELDHVIDEITQLGARVVLVSALPIPTVMEQRGPVSLDPMWSPARRAAWNDQLVRLAQRWPRHVRIVAAPDEAVMIGTLVRPDGIHAIGAPNPSFVADLRSAVRG